MQKFKWVIGIINTISIIIIILAAAIIEPTFNLEFYKSSYKKYETLKRIPVSEEDLIIVTTHLLDYLKGDVEDLNINIEVNKEMRSFFNEKEIYHMVDVKALFDLLFLVRQIAIIAFFVTFLILMLNKNWRAFYRCIKTGLVSFLSLLVLLVCIVATNFEKCFNIFHELFFTNDLWILDPSTDLLINMVPLEFFIDISLLVAGGILIGIFMIFLFVVSTNRIIKRGWKF